jgi:hypothetical protein
MDGNPNLVTTEAEIAFLEIIFERRRAEEARLEAIRLNEAIRMGLVADRNINNIRDIYHDGQNVHDNKVNQDVLKSVIYLLSKLCSLCGNCNRIFQIDKFLELEAQILPDYDYVCNDFQVKEKEKHSKCIKKYRENIKYKFKNEHIIEYICSTIEGNPVANFQKYHIDLIFMAYFNHLATFPEDIQKEIFTILDNDLPEMRQVCITGRVGRLINTLSGFDPNIEVKIADNAQIEAKYNLVSKKYKQYDTAPVVQNILRLWEFKKLLEEIMVSLDKILVWIEPFWELMEESANDIESLCLNLIHNNENIEEIKLIKHKINKDNPDDVNMSITDVEGIDYYVRSPISDENMDMSLKLNKKELELNLGKEYAICLEWVFKGLCEYIEENGDDKKDKKTIDN